jgi:SPP1 gp7 family putative phage head morphogenesis protein
LIELAQLLTVQKAMVDYRASVRPLVRKIAGKDNRAVRAAYLKPMRAAVRSWLIGMKRATDGRLGRLHGRDVDALTDQAVDWQAIERDGQRLLTPVVLRIFGAVGSRMKRRRKVKKAGDPIGSASEQAARRIVGNAIRGITEESRQAIRRVIERGIRSGADTRSIAGRIRPLIGLTDRSAGAAADLFDELTGEGLSDMEIASELEEYAGRLLDSRAETIARTETARAASEGTLRAYSDNGIQWVQWVFDGDVEKCPEGICPENDGRIMTIDEAYEEIPAHPNCECVWVEAEGPPVPEGEGE